MLKRLENEDFTRVAQELNTPDDFAGQNGYVGWVPRGAFPELDQTIFGDEEEGIQPLEPGTISEPIFADGGFFLVKVITGPEERELEDRMAFKLTVELVDSWQQDALESGTRQGLVRRNFNSELYEWVTDQVFVTAPRVDRPTPNPNQILPGAGR